MHFAEGREVASEKGDGFIPSTTREWLVKIPSVRG
jgi:hypothetical protein